MKQFKLFDDVSLENVSKIKVSLNADVFINDSLWQDEYMDLVFECKDVETGVTVDYIDKISKFIKSDIIRENEWYDMAVSKEFVVSPDKRYSISVYVSSVRYDNEWVAGTRLTIGDRKATIEIESD